MWNLSNKTRLVKTIERLDLKQAANLCGVSYQKLYQAQSNGKDGGYVQRDHETNKLYVLASEIDNLKQFLESTAPGEVQSGGMTLKEISEKTGVNLPALYMRQHTGTFPKGFIVGRRGPAILYDADICQHIKPLRHKGKTSKPAPRGTDANQICVPPPVVNVRAATTPATRIEIAVDLIKAGHEQAGIYLIQNNQ